MPHAMSDSARISPTAHYTSYVWHRHGLSRPGLVTTTGRALHAALAPMQAVYRVVSGKPDLDDHLAWRHRTIDETLERAIADGRVGQVLEIAAGLSARGARLSTRHPGLRYIEGDLPAMAETKRRRLALGPRLGANHQVVTLDALADGATSLDAVCARHLDAKVGTAIVTEGLLGYLPEDAVRSIWARVARLLGRFPHGIYLADLYYPEASTLAFTEAFRRMLGWFARGNVHMHFPSADSSLAALRAAGFPDAQVVIPSDPRLHVRVVIGRSPA